MSETGAIRDKLAALRSPLATESKAAATRQPDVLASAAARMRHLQQAVVDGKLDNAALERLVRATAAPGARPADRLLPMQLTSRAKRLLVIVQKHVDDLRAAADRLAGLASSQAHTLPVMRLYRETVALADIALRTLYAAPAEPEPQLSSCDGVEAVLQAVSVKADRLRAVLSAHELEAGRVDELAQRLQNLADGKAEPWPCFVKLAEAIWTEVGAGTPMHAYRMGAVSADRDHGSPLEPARLVACHALNVAQVAGRLLRHHADFFNRMPELIAAASVLDVGMLRIRADAWLHSGSLSAGQRRKVEGHVRAGTEMAVRLAPQAAWLHQAVAGHHERQDGTGYPGGQRGDGIPPLARWLAIADVYAALTAPRPHRAVVEPRSALAEVLSAAEQSLLDRTGAEALMHLSFYPPGTAVELADGATGVVVATHMGRRDHNTPARPVVEILQDAESNRCALPRYVDLNDCLGQSIVRALPAAEGMALLNRRWCA